MGSFRPILCVKFWRVRHINWTSGRIRHGVDASLARVGRVDEPGCDSALLPRSDRRSDRMENLIHLAEDSMIRADLAPLIPAEAL